MFKPHGIVLEEARIVAGELGLPGWWLNEQASAYVAPGGDPAAPRVFDHQGLRVAAASPEHLLAVPDRARLILEEAFQEDALRNEPLE